MLANGGLSWYYNRLLSSQGLASGRKELLLYSCRKLPTQRRRGKRHGWERVVYTLREILHFKGLTVSQFWQWKIKVIWNTILPFFYSSQSKKPFIACVGYLIRDVAFCCIAYHSTHVTVCTFEQLCAHVWMFIPPLKPLFLCLDTSTSNRQCDMY